MRESLRIYLLRILALISIMVYIYSAGLTARVVIFGNSGGIFSGLLFFAVSAAGFIAGRLLLGENSLIPEKITGMSFVRFITFIFDITDSRHFVSSAAAALTVLLPAFAAILIFRAHGLMRTIFEAALLLISYLVSLRNSHRNFDSVFNKKTVLFGFFVLAATVETSIAYGPAQVLKPVLFAFAYYYMLVFLIIKNQEDIDSNIYEKKHIEKAILPRNMRSFNTKAVVFMFAVILLLFYLKPLVLFLMDMAGKITGLVIKAFFFIMSHLFPVQPNNGGIQGSMPPNMGMNVPPPVIHPYMNLIFNIFKYFVILYLAYRVVFELLRRLPVLVRKLAALLRKLFKWDKTGEAEVADYDDVIEIIKPEKDKRKHELKSRQRRAGRDLKTITDPVERVRYIYGSVLGMLSVFGIKLEKSDTVSDVYTKAGLIEGIEIPLPPLTRIYEKVRYGDIVPDKELLQEMDKLYSDTGILLRRKVV